MNTPVDHVARVLLDLANQGSIAASNAGRSAIKRMGPLLDAGVISEERRGAGRIFKVKDPTAFVAYCQKEYPSGLCGELADPEMEGKTFAVAAFRDAHRGGSSAHNPVLLRGFGSAELVSDNGAVLPVASLTELAGVAAVNIAGASCTWRITGKVALVENIEVFFRIEEIVKDVNLAIWHGGRASNKTIEWLANHADNLELIHCGDYDPVGLSEYLKLKEACPRLAVSLFVPDNLEELFIYGEQERLRKQRPYIQKILGSNDLAVKTVIDICLRRNKGLDHEALLVTATRCDDCR